jgi:hypothetical protein
MKEVHTINGALQNLVLALHLAEREGGEGALRGPVEGQSKSQIEYFTSAEK